MIEGNLPKNAESELAYCYNLLEKIEDDVLKNVAIAIFAPTGTFKPRPIDHAKAFSRLPSGIRLEIKNRGGLAEAFKRDRQAYALLSEAIDRIHALYRAKILGQDSKFTLEQSLEQISARRIF